MGRLAKIRTAREAVLDHLSAQAASAEAWRLGWVADPAALTSNSETAADALQRRAFFPENDSLWHGAGGARSHAKLGTVMLCVPSLSAVMERHGVAPQSLPSTGCIVAEPEPIALDLPRGTAPVVLDIRAGDVAPAQAAPLGRAVHIPMRARSGDRVTLCFGQLSDWAPARYGPVSHVGMTLTLPVGPLGDGTALLAILAVEHLLNLAVRQGQPSAWVVRIDYAALGLSRVQIRHLEHCLTASLAAYGARTGQSGLVLGHVGFVGSYADARVQLAGGQSCRLDLIAARNRTRPTLVTVIQEGRAPLSVTLDSPDLGALICDEIDTQTEVLTDLPGRTIAAVGFDPNAPTSAERRTHVIGIAPSAVEIRGQPGVSSDGTWEITVRNMGDAPVALTFKVDESVSLMRKATAPATVLTLSRSVSWDPEMSDFARPVFYDVQARVTAVSQMGVALPPHVVRCYGDPLDWPKVKVCFGAEMRHMELGATGFPVVAPNPAGRVPSAAPVLERLMAPQLEDSVLAKCLAVVHAASPETLAATLRTKM